VLDVKDLLGDVIVALMEVIGKVSKLLLVEWLEKDVRRSELVCGFYVV
jgi:hypothetical protein